MALTGYLSAREIETLAALVDTIVPADRYLSGTEAGVLEYLDRQFATDLAAHLPAYRHGLDALDALSFADLDIGDRTARLRAMQSDGERGRWLAEVVGHVMEGFYTAPAAWEMVGFRVTG